MNPRAWGLGLLLIYSVAHFAVTGIAGAVRVMGNDILSAFPGPLIAGREAWADTIALLFPPGTWNYGPVAQFWTYPLGIFRSVPNAMLALLLINYVLLGVSFAIWLAELARGRDRARTCAVMLVVWLNYFPLLTAITGREIEIFEFFLLSVAFHYLRRGGETVAGALVGLATMTKFLPGLFVPYLLLKRRWRAATAAVVMIAVTALAAQWLLDFRKSITFTLSGEVKASSVIARDHPENQALTNVVQRELLRLSATVRTSKLVGNVLQGLVGGLALLAMWRRRHVAVGVWDYSIMLMTMIIVPPWSNVYYLMFLVVPFSAAFVWLTDRSGSRWHLATVVIAYLMSGYMVPFSVLGAPLGLSAIDVRFLLGSLSLPGIGLLLLYATFWELEAAAKGSAITT
ncbi:MAG: DUF2029 domain-containing protein [Candidatus Rokubacteria bacterium]|nr:DUF2029 domain-containing protein [Candidatus Rokubacteria bacterium]